MSYVIVTDNLAWTGTRWAPASDGWRLVARWATLEGATRALAHLAKSADAQAATQAYVKRIAPKARRR